MDLACRFVTPDSHPACTAHDMIFRHLPVPPGRRMPLAFRAHAGNPGNPQCTRHSAFALRYPDLRRHGCRSGTPPPARRANAGKSESSVPLSFNSLQESHWIQRPWLACMHEMQEHFPAHLGGNDEDFGWLVLPRHKGAQAPMSWIGIQPGMPEKRVGEPFFGNRVPETMHAVAWPHCVHLRHRFCNATYISRTCCSRSSGRWRSHP